MNLKQSILIILCIVITQTFIQAQTLKNHRGTHVLTEEIKGRATFSYYEISTDSIQYHGRYNFVSDAYEIERGNSIRQININGNYQKGLKNGSWAYDQNDYQIKIRRISGLSVEAVLNGYQRRLSARYNDGIPNGIWELSINEVVESRRRGKSAESSANFTHGVATGAFLYSDTAQSFHHKISGEFDESGNFHGNWKLAYMKNGFNIIEDRSYVNGFLLHLKAVDVVSDSILFDVAFDEIESKLEAIKNETDTNFRISNGKFGILFDDGYANNDNRIEAQKEGNEFLLMAIGYYSDSTFVKNLLPGFSIPKMAYTRRFEYIYPKEEEFLVGQLSDKIKKLEHQYDSILNSSALLVNRQKNDSLAFFYGYLELGMDKIEIVENVVNQIKEGRFTYQFRDNLYREGIVDLRDKDTVSYEYEDATKYKLVEFSTDVSGPENLVANMYTYVEAIDKNAQRLIEYAQGALRTLKREENIAKMEEEILAKIDAVNFKYTGNFRFDPNLANETIIRRHPVNELQLDVYRKLGRTIRNQLMQEYSNIDEYNIKLDKGEAILSLMSYLLYIFDDLKIIPDMASSLDSAYTRYSPNPFFDRDLESRIKPGIYQRGAEFLLPNFIDEIKRSNSEEELAVAVGNVKKLYNRLIELSERDDEEVRRMNARIRRETSVERIRRLLGV
ncbi:MAG: hypothetical protein JJU28_15365 [Cyclobacteriaceae bacterium]|nr:hypothetical protein [Cyclobacteriaceae bacterium]